MSADLPVPPELTAWEMASTLWLLGQALLLEGLIPSPQEKSRCEYCK